MPSKLKSNTPLWKIQLTPVQQCVLRNWVGEPKTNRKQPRTEGSKPHSSRPSLQGRRSFGERVLNNFITNIMAVVFDFNNSGRLGREINLYQGGGWRSKIRRGMGMWWVLFALPLPPTPTVQSNFKSNMAGRINDRELITLARTNWTPALQASQDRELSIFVSSTTEISQYALRHLTVTFFMSIFFFPQIASRGVERLFPAPLTPSLTS